MGSQCSTPKNPKVVWPIVLSAKADNSRPDIVSDGDIRSEDAMTRMGSPRPPDSAKKTDASSGVCDTRRRNYPSGNKTKFPICNLNDSHYHEQNPEGEDGNPQGEFNIDGSEHSYDDSSDRRIIEYQKGSLIDNSEYAEVWECLDLTTGERLAVKIYKVGQDFEVINQCVEMVGAHITELQNPGHNNLVQYYAIDVKSDQDQSTNIDVTMKFVSGGYVGKLFDRFNNAREEKIVQFYTKQILDGLAYIHSKEIVHGNLKGTNVLIDTDGVIKLTDTHLTNQLKYLVEVEDPPEKSNPSSYDSVYWTAPEVLRDSTQLGYMSDVWSLGCVVYEMLTGECLWGEKPKQEAYELLIEGKIPPLPKNISKHCEDFLKCTLQIKPEDRWSVDRLFDHDFIRNIDNDAEASVIFDTIRTLPTIAQIKTTNVLGQNSSIKTGSSKKSDKPAKTGQNPVTHFHRKLSLQGNIQKRSLSPEGLKKTILAEVHELDEDYSPAASAEKNLHFSGKSPMNGDLKSNESPLSGKERREMFATSNHLGRRSKTLELKGGDLKTVVEQDEDPDKDVLEVQEEESGEESDQEEENNKQKPSRTSVFKETEKVSLQRNPSNVDPQKTQEQLFKEEQRKKYEEQMAKILAEAIENSLISQGFSRSPTNLQEVDEEADKAEKARIRAEFEAQMAKQLFGLPSDELGGSQDVTHRSANGEGEAPAVQPQMQLFGELLQGKLRSLLTNDFQEEPGFSRKSTVKTSGENKQFKEEVFNVLSHEDQRRIFEEEMLKQLMKIKTNELNQSYSSVTPGQTFRQSQFGEAASVTVRKPDRVFKNFEEELSRKFSVSKHDNRMSKDISYLSPAETKRQGRHEIIGKIKMGSFGFEDELINELSKIKSNDVSQDLASPPLSPNHLRRVLQSPAISINAKQKSLTVKPIVGLNSPNFSESVRKRMSQRSHRKSNMSMSSARSEHGTDQLRPEVTKELQEFQTKSLTNSQFSTKRRGDAKKDEVESENVSERGLPNEEQINEAKFQDEVIELPDKLQNSDRSEVLTLSFYVREKTLSEDRNLGDNKDNGNPGKK